MFGTESAAFLHLPVRRDAMTLAKSDLMKVTDLHIRNTRFRKGVNASALTDRNILLRGSDEMAIQEIFTLLMSTRGAMSDSLSDDPDGGNHCFVGRKLWLA